MKNLLLFIAIISLTSQLFAQTEFKTYENGLIYSEKTMKKLERIVDSLNLKYKVCHFNKVFNAKYQAVGHKVRLDTGDIKQAKKDLENNIGFEDFLSKYPDAELDKNVLVVKYKYKNCIYRLNSGNIHLSLIKNYQTGHHSSWHNPQNNFYHNPYQFSLQ